MATSDRPRGQTRLGQYGVDPYELGDCLTDTAANSSSKKLILRECPLCRMDPTRPRHPFDTQDKRAVHFRNDHDASEI